MDVVQKPLHAVTFLVYSYGLYFDHYKVAIPPTSNSFLMTFHVIGGRWKYLTYITLVRIRAWLAAEFAPLLSFVVLIIYYNHLIFF